MSSEYNNLSSHENNEETTKIDSTIQTSRHLPVQSNNRNTRKMSEYVLC